MKKIRLLIADDHELMREGIHSQLSPLKNIEIAGTASNGKEAVAAAADLKPDVVLMDIRMPDMNGVEATRRIMRKQSGTRVIALSIYADKHLVKQMFEAGASGYLLKDCTADELVEAIMAVASGKHYLCPRIAGVVVDNFIRDPHPEETVGPENLSVRERQVLALIAEGLTTKEIAYKLKISAETIATHRRRITAKLGIRSSAELTKYAVREGLASL